jgi:hypothetical protein
MFMSEKHGLRTFLVYLLQTEVESLVHLQRKATQVNAWDRLILANSEKLELIHKSSEKTKADQGRMEQELDFIAGQQRELEEILKPLEEETDKQLGTVDLSGASDPLTTIGQRTAIYRSAVELDAQLKSMSDDLKRVIDQINARTDVDGPAGGDADITSGLSQKFQ